MLIFIWLLATENFEYVKRLNSKNILKKTWLGQNSRYASKQKSAVSVAYLSMLLCDYTKEGNFKACVEETGYIKFST